MGIGALIGAGAGLGGYNAAQQDQRSRADQMMEKAYQIALQRQQMQQQGSQFDRSQSLEQQRLTQQGDEFRQGLEATKTGRETEIAAGDRRAAGGYWNSHLDNLPAVQNSIATAFPGDPIGQAKAIISVNGRTAALGKAAGLSDDEIRSQMLAVPGENSGRTQTVTTATPGGPQLSGVTGTGYKGFLVPQLMPTTNTTTEEKPISNPALPVPEAVQAQRAQTAYILAQTAKIPFEQALQIVKLKAEQGQQVFENKMKIVGLDQDWKKFLGGDSTTRRGQDLGAATAGANRANSMTIAQMGAMAAAGRQEDSFLHDDNKMATAAMQKQITEMRGRYSILQDRVNSNSAILQSGVNPKTGQQLTEGEQSTLNALINADSRKGRDILDQYKNLFPTAPAKTSQPRHPSGKYAQPGATMQQTGTGRVYGVTGLPGQ